jgi:hypothetical protein
MRAIRVAGWLAGAAVACAVLGDATASAQGSGRRWIAEGGAGLVANTPDDEGFALNLGVDRKLTDMFSVGPLLQLGFTDDSVQTGLSAQGKVTFEIDPRFDVSVQGGIGFVNSDFQGDDTSFLIPLGTSVHYRLRNGLGLGGTFLLNLTDLDTGPGGDTNVMPAVTFGVRY